MRKIKEPKKSDEKVFKLKSAVIDGYEFTKTYYKMVDGVPVKSDVGDDTCLTIINIRKQGNDPSKAKRAFIFSEGYVGAEKSYKEDGRKSLSVARKDGFGIAFLIKYIENAKENNVDNFHVMFLSNKETSENQAALYAQAIQDITTENVEKTYIWNHSKSGLLALRAFEKMKESGDPRALAVLKKAKAVLTSMPTKGIDAVNREKMANKIDGNKFISILPFSGFIKTAALSAYDRFFYKPTPAQVDLKTEETELQLKPVPEGKLAKFFSKVWGNDAFRNRVYNAKKVPYDKDYLGRTTGEENLKTIEDVDYKILPVDIGIKDALDALVRHGQLMPFILYAKKLISKEKGGDGIVKYSEQGMEDIKAKYKVDTVVKAGHDVSTRPEALKTIKNELVDDQER